MAADRRRSRPRRSPSASAHGDPGVAVEEAEAVVVGGDQDRPAGVPLVASSRPRRWPRRAALDLPVPVGDAAGAVAVGAEQPVARRAPSAPPSASPASAAARSRRARGEQAAREQRTRGSSVSSKLDRGRRLRAAVEHRVGVAVAQRLGERADRLAEPVGGARARRRRRAARRRAADQVGEHRAGLDEASWSGSPTRISRASGRTRLEQPGHHRQRHHRASRRRRRRRAAAGCARWWRNRVRDAGSASRAAGGGSTRLQPGEPGAVVVGEPVPACAASTASCSRAAALPVGAVSAIRSGPVLGLLGEQRQQPGDGRGLAGAGTAGEHGRPLRGRPRAAAARCSA